MRLLLTADAELPVPPPLYGGIERVIASLIEEFRRRGHEVGLVADRGSVVETAFFRPWPGLTSTGRGDSVRNALALRRAVPEFRPALRPPLPHALSTRTVRENRRPIPTDSR
jgi:hypothetical protein